METPQGIAEQPLTSTFESSATGTNLSLLELPNDPLVILMEFLNEEDLGLFDVCCPLLYAIAKGEWARREERYGLNKKKTHHVPHARARVLRWHRTAAFAECMENQAISHGNRPSSRTSQFELQKHQCSGCSSFPDHLDVNCFTAPLDYDFFIRISYRDWITEDEGNSNHHSETNRDIPKSKPIAMGFVTDASCEAECVKAENSLETNKKNNLFKSRLDLPCTIHSYSMERFLRCYHYNEEDKCVYHKDYHDAFEEAIDKLCITVVGVRNSGSMSLVVSTNGFQKRIRSCPAHGVNLDFYDLTPKNIQSHCYADTNAHVTVSTQTIGANSDSTSGRLFGFQVYYQRGE